MKTHLGLFRLLCGETLSPVGVVSLGIPGIDTGRDGLGVR